MLQALKLSGRKTPKSLLWDNFRRGVNRQGDPSEINQNRDQQNCVMDLYGMRKREGTVKKGATIGTVKGTGLKELVIKSKTYFLAVCAQTLKKWNLTDGDTDWSNTDKTTLTTTLNTRIKSFTFIDGAAADTGTADAGGTTRTMIDAAKSWTIDAYIGYVVKITGGTGSGQAKLIVGNEADRLYVNEPFDTAPDATSTYGLYQIDDLACVVNGTDTPFKYNGTASTNLSPPATFIDVEKHDKRLWGVVGKTAYFSDEAVGDQFSQNSTIPLLFGDGNALRCEGLNEQLVVYKKNAFGIISGSNGVYGVRQRSGTVGLYAVNSLATGAEMQFFLSERGVELVNRFENDVTAAILPISENIKPWLDAHSASEKQLACGGVYENFYYLCIPLGYVYYTYRYDIMASDFTSPDPRKQVWDRFKGWPANMFAVLNGQLSFISNVVSSNCYVYTALSGNSDDGTAIDLILDTEDTDFGLPDGDKEVDKIHIFAETSTADITYTIEYRLNVASSWTTLGTVNTKTGLDASRKVTLDLYKRCRTLGVRVTRSDSLAATEGRIIKILAHYHLDTRE